MKGLTYKDPATIYNLKRDEYGDESIVADTAVIKCLFLYSMGSDQSNFVEGIKTDAHAYLDIGNKFIQANKHRLEGMYIVFNRYGEDVWYKIERVVIGRTVLLDNKDNNIHVYLSKSAAMLTDRPNPPEST